MSTELATEARSRGDGVSSLTPNQKLDTCLCAQEGQQCKEGTMSVIKPGNAGVGINVSVRHGEALAKATGVSSNSEVVPNKAGCAIDTEPEHTFTPGEGDASSTGRADTNHHLKPSSSSHLQLSTTKSTSHCTHPASLTPSPFTHTHITAPPSFPSWQHELLAKDGGGGGGCLRREARVEGVELKEQERPEVNRGESQGRGLTVADALGATAAVLLN